MNDSQRPRDLRRHEFGQRRIADHDLGAEAEPLHEAADDELVHVLREGGGERGETEDQQVDLIGEAPAEPVADEAGDERTDRHADEGEGDELQVLRQRRELGLDRRRRARRRRRRDRSRRRTCRRRPARRCDSGTTRSAAGRAARRHSLRLPLVSPLDRMLNHRSCCPRRIVVETACGRYRPRGRPRKFRARIKTTDVENNPPSGRFPARKCKAYWIALPLR